MRRIPRSIGKEAGAPSLANRQGFQAGQPLIMNLIGPQHVVLAARELICTTPGKSEHAAGDGCMLPSCLAQYETYPTVNWQRSWRAEPCQLSRVSGGATAHHCEMQTGSQS